MYETNLLDSEKKIIDAITEFNNDIVVQKLESFYFNQSVPEIFGVSRQENSHSTFLAWLFNPVANHGLGNKPLIQLFYYDNCSDEIPEIFYDYINHYAEELARDTSTLFLKDRNDLYADLFGYNELSVENYEKLLPLFNGAFPEVELLADLDYTRLSVLIRQGRVAFDQESLAAINKTEALADYILWHPTYFMQHLDWKYDFAANSVQTILSSAKFSSDDKCKIIGVIPIAIIQDSKDIANSAIDILCNNKKINVADETLVCVVKSSTDTNKKIALTTNIVRSGIVNHALIRHLLDAIGEPYTEVGDKSKKPLLPNDALHQELLSALRQIKFISTSKPDKDGEKLRVYPTRTTYIF